MQLTDEAKKNILEFVLGQISKAADKEYQKRVWIKGEGPDFDEFVCLFFDDGDPLIKKYKDFGITDFQYEILKKFRDEFRIFVNQNDFPEEFINTPEWAGIMAAAKEVLVAFNYQKKSERF